MLETGLFLNIGYVSSWFMIGYWICRSQMYGMILHISQRNVYGWVLYMSEFIREPFKVKYKRKYEIPVLFVGI
jgi:hypothetical protein